MKLQQGKRKNKLVKMEAKSKNKKEKDKEKITKVLNKFVKEILREYKREVKAIWVLGIGREWLINLLIDDLKISKDKAREIEIYALKIAQSLRKELVLHIAVVGVTSYYDAIIENRIDVFLEIKKAICLYDPLGFFIPIKKLIEKGEVKGTKEAMFRLIMEVRKNMKELRAVKIDVLSRIYTAVIDAAESALIARGLSFFIPKDIPKLLESEFFKKKLISKKTLQAFKEIYNAYKDYEHGALEEIEGKKIDALIKKADLFITEMQDLVDRAFESVEKS